MATREQEYAEVRRLLNFPKEQAPSPDAIVAALIRQEQFMMNELNGSGRGWSSNTIQLTTVADTAEYTLSVTGFGRPLFIYRVAAANVIVPVPFAGYDSELNNQQYDFVYIPPQSGEFPGYSGEKIAFFRDHTNAIKARVYPIPSEARVYQVVYATGALDWSTFAWTDEPALPEWSHYRCLLTALTLIDDCEWAGKTPQENESLAGRKSRNMLAQVGLQKPEYDAYLRNPVMESSIDTVDAWYGNDL